MLCDTVALICMADACPWFEVGVVELYTDMALARIATTITAAIAAVRHICRPFGVSLFDPLVASFSLDWFMIPRVIRAFGTEYTCLHQVENMSNWWNLDEMHHCVFLVS